MVLFLALPRSASTRKVKPIWILLKQGADSEWQWHQLGHMQVCTLIQTDNHTSTPPLSFFTDRMPFLSPNQQRQSTEGKTECKENMWNKVHRHTESVVHFIFTQHDVPSTVSTALVHSRQPSLVTMPHYLSYTHNYSKLNVSYSALRKKSLLLQLQTFNGLFSRTTWVSRYQKGKTNLDFAGARDSEWQWHQLGSM